MIRLLKGTRWDGPVNLFSVGRSIAGPEPACDVQLLVPFGISDLVCRYTSVRMRWLENYRLPRTTHCMYGAISSGIPATVYHPCTSVWEVCVGRGAG